MNTYSGATQYAIEQKRCCNNSLLRLEEAVSFVAATAFANLAVLEWY